MTRSSSVLRNVGSNLGRDGVLAIVALALNPFLYVRLGADGFGLISLTGSTIGLLYLLDGGLAHAVERYVSRYRAQQQFERVNATVATALLAYCAIGLLSGLALAWGGPWLAQRSGVPEALWPLMPLLFGLTGASLGIRFAGSCLDGFLRGWERFDLSNVGVVTERSVYAVGCFTLLGSGDDGIVTVAWVQFVAMLIAQSIKVALAFRAWDGLRPFPGQARWTLLREQFAFGSFAYLTQFASFLEQTGVRWLISAFLGTGALGGFSLVMTLLQFLTRAARAVTQVAMPMASRLEATGDREALQRLFWTGSRFALALVVPVGLWTAFGSLPLLRLWVDAELAPWAPILTGLVGVLLIEQSLGTANMVLLGSGRARSIGLAYTLGTSLTFFSLWWMLGAGLGGLGAIVWATLLGTVARRAWVLLSVSRALQIPWHRYLRQVLGPALLPGGAIAAALTALLYAGFDGDLAWLITSALITALVGTTLTWTWSFSQREREHVRAVLRRQAPKTP